MPQQQGTEPVIRSMRFKPDERLIDLMVGQLFYKSPEVAMRELLLRAVQNGGAGEESRRFNLAAHMSAVL
jgi:hypothetical protein